MAETTEQRRGVDLSGLPEDDRAILNRVMWLEDRVAELEAAGREAVDAFGRQAFVGDHDAQNAWERLCDLLTPSSPAEAQLGASAPGDGAGDTGGASVVGDPAPSLRHLSRTARTYQTKTRLPSAI